ncbi:MAG: S24/S26 family peptidase [Nitrospiraceae bacterium]
MARLAGGTEASLRRREPLESVPATAAISAADLSEQVPLSLIGNRVTFRVASDSMTPTLQAGDELTIGPATGLRIGDLVLYESEEGLVCHRLRATNEAGELVMSGDAAPSATEAVDGARVKGLVSAVIHAAHPNSTCGTWSDKPAAGCSWAHSGGSALRCSCPGSRSRSAPAPRSDQWRCGTRSTVLVDSRGGHSKHDSRKRRRISAHCRCACPSARQCSAHWSAPQAASKSVPSVGDSVSIVFQRSPIVPPEAGNPSL